MTIAKRIEALEQLLNPQADDLTLAVYMGGQTETGWTGSGVTIDKMPGEPDADFKTRALKELGTIFPGPVERCRALGELLPG